MQRDHRRTVLSPPPETMKDPSVENSMARIEDSFSLSDEIAALEESRLTTTGSGSETVLNNETLRELREAAIVASDAAAVVLKLVFDVLFFFDATAVILNNKTKIQIKK